MNFQQLLQQARRGAGGGAAAPPPVDASVADTSETVHISSLALLKMLKHGRAGVPMEVMGLMLGEFIDDYTVQVVDVFAMPQSGTGVSVEAVDPVFQTKMLDMLKQTSRPQMVVGWYHSHPGFGCWLSGVDINCFPVEDHQILTEEGFFYYKDVMNYLSKHSSLGIASYVDGRLEWNQITASDISYHSGKHNIVNFKGKGNNVNIRPTDNHQMWVRADLYDNKGGCSAAYKFYDAKKLAAMDPNTSIRFSAQFESGVAGIDSDGISLPFAVALGLTNKIQVDAFLWLYGYFLANGWLDAAHDGGSIMFGPVKSDDCDQLDYYLSLLGLAHLPSATVGIHGYWKAAQPNSNGQIMYRICSARWWNYFAEEYAHQATATSLATSAEDIDSNNKRCWWWVFKLLNKDQLRKMLDGLFLADGHNDPDSDHPLIFTKSARFRDEIQMIALMAGYTADWEIHYEKGNVNATNAAAKEIGANSTAWKIQFHEYIPESQARINVSDITTDRQEEGAVWCVTVPSPHLIMVRRVLKKEDNNITLASRPLIVGNTQQSFEALNKRAVAVVIDPIQSVKGKVVIDAFRLINPQLMMMGGAAAPRQTTSNLGHLRKPSIQALIHNLNRHYYSINIAYAYRKNEGEQKMLLNLHKKTWTHGLLIETISEHQDKNTQQLKEMSHLCQEYVKRLDDEEGKTEKELLVENVGKIDPKKHLANKVEEVMTSNISQTLGMMIDTIIF